MNDREFSDIEILNVREREYRCLCTYYVINTYASLMYELKKKLERYLRVNLLGPGPSSYKKIIYRAAVLQRLGNTVLDDLVEDALLGFCHARCCWFGTYFKTKLC
jgi:hypothetical protein